MNTRSCSTVATTLAVVTLSLLVAACCYPKAGPAPGPLTPSAVAAASTRWPGVTPASLAEGRDLFVARCNACHHSPDTSAIADDKWPGILDKMAPKASLTADQKAEVLHFILASRAEAAR